MLTGLAIGGFFAAIGLLFGLARRGLGPEGVQSISRLNGAIEVPALAGRTLIAIGAGAVLTLAGMQLETTIGRGGFSGDTRDMTRNLLASTTPGAIKVNMQDIPVSKLNEGLSAVTGQSSYAWNNDPYGAIFTQHEGDLIRVMYFDQSFINDHHQTQLKVITYDKNKAPEYLSSLPPDRSYHNLISDNGSVNADGASAVRSQLILLRGANTALVNGGTDLAQRLVQTASAASHRTQ